MQLIDNFPDNFNLSANWQSTTLLQRRLSRYPLHALWQQPLFPFRKFRGMLLRQA